MLSLVRLSVCRLPVTFVHPTQPVSIFRNISTPLDTVTSADVHGKYYGDRSREPTVARMGQYA